MFSLALLGFRLKCNLHRTIHLLVLEHYSYYNHLTFLSQAFFHAEFRPFQSFFKNLFSLLDNRTVFCYHDRDTMNGNAKVYPQSYSQKVDIFREFLYFFPNFPFIFHIFRLWKKLSTISPQEARL